MTQSINGWHVPAEFETTEEIHYGRRLRCFRRRPNDLDAMFRTVVQNFGEAEALVAARDISIAPDAPAPRDWERVSYRALDQRADALASGLAARGVGRGDRVAILLANRSEFACAVLAAARLGAIAVPLNIREQKPELQYVLDHCGALVLIFEAELAERIPAHLAQMRHRFAVGGDVAGAEPIAAAYAAAPPPRALDIDEDSCAVILYTSGTTGKPKGATLTHFNLMHSVLHFALTLSLRPGDRTIMAVPASHVTGLVAILITSWYCAGCAVLAPRFKAAEFLPLASKERMTYSILVPAMYNLCLLQPDFDQYDLAAWRLGGYGGAPMPQGTIAHLAEKLPHLELVNAYGATETTSPATITPPGQGARRADSVGRIVPCAVVRVVNEAGEEQPFGVAGEILIGGPMVVPGYWNDPSATARAFSEGFWHSGDVGTIDADGYVRLHDRIKDMVNRGGYKVFSAEVESELSFHPEVIECALVAQPDTVLGEKTHCFVVAKQPNLDAANLRAYLAARLSDYKVPDFFTFLDQPLPRNANGKILKRELRARIAGQLPQSS
jgi:acyl-CoA synthetase (AMP-forming)/AMP-acid ligase II